MAEGKRREVRRLFEAVDITVSRLIRIMYGVVSLPENLRRGMSTEISSKAIEALLKTVGMKQVGFKKNNSWKKGRPSDNSKVHFGASLSANVRSKISGAKRASFRPKIGLQIGALLEVLILILRFIYWEMMTLNQKIGCTFVKVGRTNAQSKGWQAPKSFTNLLGFATNSSGLQQAPLKKQKIPVNDQNEQTRMQGR